MRVEDRGELILQQFAVVAHLVLNRLPFNKERVCSTLRVDGLNRIADGTNGIIKQVFPKLHILRNGDIIVNQQAILIVLGRDGPRVHGQGLVPKRVVNVVDLYQVTQGV